MSPDEYARCSSACGREVLSSEVYSIRKCLLLFLFFNLYQRSVPLCLLRSVLRGPSCSRATTRMRRRQGRPWTRTAGSTRETSGSGLRMELFRSLTERNTSLSFPKSVEMSYSNKVLLSLLPFPFPPPPPPPPFTGGVCSSREGGECLLSQSPGGPGLSPWRQPAECMCGHHSP